MARFHEARQRKQDGRFDFTISSDDEGWAHATGYCAGWKELGPLDELVAKWGQSTADGLVKAQERARPFRALFHDDGHATAAEACECHERYILDLEMVLHEAPERPERLERCAVCDEWCAGLAIVGDFWHANLCPKHLNAADVELLYQRQRSERQQRVVEKRPSRPPVDPRLHTPSPKCTAPHPHCDDLVLHAPGKCEHCDLFEERQKIRASMGVNFTGETDSGKARCPAEERRELDTINRWGGNVARPKAEG